MLDIDNRLKCVELLTRYGPAPQILLLIEECSELQKEACKLIRYEDAPIEIHNEICDRFQEELVDVIVMVTQMCVMQGLTESDINRMAKAKLDRALAR